MMHLIVDGVACERQLLRNTEALSSWLVHFTEELLNMKVLAGPVCAEVVEPDPDPGITGVVIISKSHVIVHTWPHGKEGNTVNIDIFSCESFSRPKVLGYIEDTWHMTGYKSKLIHRPTPGGLEYV